MTGSARVQSIQDLAELRAFLVVLAEKIRDAVTTANSDVNTTAQWINHTQPARWKAECAKSERLVQDATEALRRKRMSPTSDGRPPNTMVEQKMLRAAKERSEHARGKATAVQQWQRKYEKQMFEYRRCAQTAQALSEQVIPRAIEFLDKLRDHLEKYTQGAFAHDAPPPGDRSADDQPSVAMPVPQEVLDLLAMGPPTDEPHQEEEPDR